jgi:succinate-acetate transporter protein
MAQQYSNPQPTPFPPRGEREEPVVARADVASPAPLGLNVLAFATAIIGCFYTGFIVPYEATSIRTAISPFLLILGIILVLAGMWEYRKNYTVHATVFTSYGGFLAALGVVFLPSSGIVGALAGSGNLPYVLGMVFLSWTIFTGILFLGTLRTSASMSITMLVLFAAYLLLTIGMLMGNNYAVVHAGGWLAIATAVIAWLSGLGSIMSTTSALGAFRLPLGRRLVVVE